MKLNRRIAMIVAAIAVLAAAGAGIAKAVGVGDGEQVTGPRPPSRRRPRR